MSETPDFYELSEVHVQKEGFMFATAAFINCGLCGVVIDSMGGPGHGAVCNRCAKELIFGRLRGCVIWSDEGDAA